MAFLLNEPYNLELISDKIVSIKVISILYFSEYFISCENSLKILVIACSFKELTFAGDVVFFEHPINRISMIKK